MFKKYLVPSIAMASLFATSLALATPADANVGLYGEVNLGSNITSISIFNDTDYVSAFNTFGWNINAGYQFNENIALESGFTQFVNGNGSFQVVDGVVKGIVPVASRIDLFAKLGGAYIYADGDGGGALYAGVGAGFGVTRNLDVTIQIAGFTSGFVSNSLFSGGVTYHFTH